MTNKQMRSFVFFLVVWFTVLGNLFAQELTDLSAQSGASQTQTLAAVESSPTFNPFPSGLLVISDYKYPVFLYAPKEYRPDRNYPMIMVAPSEGAKAEEGIEYLKGVADREMIFILSTEGLWTEDDDVPTNLDTWLLRVKNDVAQRFPIDKKRVFIVGKGTGAQYGAYLAMQYNHDFSGAALLGQAWDGPFSQLIYPESNPAEQVPFFVVFRKDQPDSKLRNQKWLDTLQLKGYPLKVVEVADAQGLDALGLKKEAFSWLETTSKDLETIVASKQKGFKSKLKKGIKDFFTV